MKIEELNFKFEEKNVEEGNFDIEKWRLEKPVDYFKAVSAMLSAPNITPQVPREIAIDTAFEVLYKTFRLYIPDVLYKYYSLTDDDELNSKKFETLKNQLVYMSNINDFNDPFDGKAFFYNPAMLKKEKRLKKIKGKIIDDFTVFHKGAAFTANDMQSMPMWAHYANNHYGFCVAYDMTDVRNLDLKSCTFPVQYTNERLDITSYMKTYVEMINRTIDKDKKYGVKKHIIYDMSLIYLSAYLCNIKHSTWEYEKEFRCTMGVNSTGMPYAKAYPKAIYIGLNCAKDNEKKLLKIAKELKIPIYKMVFNDLSGLYKFEIKQKH